MNFYRVSEYIKANYPEYYGYETYPKTGCVTIHKVDGEWAYSAISRRRLLGLTACCSRAVNSCSN